MSTTWFQWRSFKEYKLSDKRRSAVRLLGIDSLEDRSVMAVTVADVFGPNIKDVYVAPTAPLQFSTFSVVDASLDDSLNTVFTGGALRVNYGMGTPMIAMQDNNGPLPPPPPPNPISRISIEIYQGSTEIAEIGNFTSSTLAGGLVNLRGVSLPAGLVNVKAHAYFTNGAHAWSTGQYMTLKAGQMVQGNFTAQSFDINALNGDGVVVHGLGGTDVLRLNAFANQIASLNGKSISLYNPTAGGQAIYQGLAVDYVRLTNGREVYFTGIEKLEILDEPPFQSFVTSTTAQPVGITRVVNLIPIPNDANFGNQWNLHATDTTDAWRFSKGSGSVLLVSLDTGVIPANAPGGAITGINQNRLITDPTDNDGGSPGGHGHQSISVMIGQANDGLFHTGINWVSKVFVTDVYDGETLQNAIKSAFIFADANNLKVIFQGGIQGESWLTHGGTQAALEALIDSHASRALFAIAAGNGGPNGNLNDPNFLTSVSGVAKLQTNHANVMSVGALQRISATINGFQNATSVHIASYSNRGSNLTMVAPTDSLSTNFFGSASFGGTSCANPNLAAMASLVWSVNTSLSAAQVRGILQATAMDLGVVGRDNTFGSGLVDTGRAVRRAVALARDPSLAALATSFNPLPGNGVFVEGSVASRTPGAMVNLPPEVGNNLALKSTIPGIDFAHMSKPIIMAEGMKKVTPKMVESHPSTDMELDLAFSTVNDFEQVAEMHVDLNITMDGIDDVLSESFV